MEWLRWCVVVGLAISIILPQALAIEEIADKIYTSKELIVHQEISSDLMIPSGIYSAEVFVSFLPRTNYRQSVIEQESYPESKSLGDVLQFSWVQPSFGTYDLTIETTMRTQNTYVPVFEQVPYPIDTSLIPSEFQQYLGTSRTIDINEEIEEKAKLLAGNSTDLFEITHSIANWVESNIEYDLSTITADVSQPASWTLDNRIGVCDELTNLYIAMLRSLGIPARFVSGISYTNSPLFENPWGPHAWAEVYFPGYGWVPFDITYKQFGHLDASHITLKTSRDADQSFTRYSWKGTGNKVSLSPLQYNTTIQTYIGTVEKTVDIQPTFIFNSTNIDSANALVLQIKNTQPYYVSSYIQIASPIEIDLPQYRIELFKPFETREFIMPFTLQGLQPGFKYTLPVEISELYGASAEATFQAAQQFNTYQVDDIQTVAKAAEESVKCSVLPLALVGNPFTLSCTIEQQTATVCIAEECIETTNGVTEVTLQFDQKGIQEVPITITVDEDTIQTQTIVTVKATPNIDLDITAPNTLDYQESSTIDLMLSPTSGSPAQDIDVQLYIEPVPVSFAIPLLDRTHVLQSTVQGSQLLPGQNKVDVHISYKDALGNTYKKNETLLIDVTGVNTAQKWYLQIKRWLLNILR